MAPGYERCGICGDDIEPNEFDAEGAIIDKKAEIIFPSLVLAAWYTDTGFIDVDESEHSDDFGYFHKGCLEKVVENESEMKRLSAIIKHVIVFYDLGITYEAELCEFIESLRNEFKRETGEKKGTGTSPLKCSCGERDAGWKGIPTREYKKEYPTEKWLFCGECMVDLFSGTWTGGGPFSSDFSSFEKIVS